MSWFKDNLNPNDKETSAVDKDAEATYSLAASYKANPYEAVVVDLDDFEQINLDTESLKDGKVNVITDKSTNVSK